MKRLFFIAAVCMLSCKKESKTFVASTYTLDSIVVEDIDTAFGHYSSFTIDYNKKDSFQNYLTAGVGVIMNDDSILFVLKGDGVISINGWIFIEDRFSRGAPVSLYSSSYQGYYGQDGQLANFNNFSYAGDYLDSINSLSGFYLSSDPFQSTMIKRKLHYAGQSVSSIDEKIWHLNNNVISDSSENPVTFDYPHAFPVNASLMGLDVNEFLFNSLFREISIYSNFSSTAYNIYTEAYPSFSNVLYRTLIAYGKVTFQLHNSLLPETIRFTNPVNNMPVEMKISYDFDNTKQNRIKSMTIEGCQSILFNAPKMVYTFYYKN